MVDKPLKGRVALVTGAYQNLGVVTAAKLAEFGADIIINDLDIPELEGHKEKALNDLRSLGIRAEAISADLSKSNEISEMCEKAIRDFGKVDILVNNAGPFNMQPYLELEEKTWDLIMDVNLKAIYLITKALAPQMKLNGWGRIISMSAGSAYVRNHNVYTLAKLSIQVLTESLALELGPEITVNAIAPGQIYESLPEIAKFDPTFGDRYSARTPTRRLTRRSEVATLISRLCTPEFDQVSGVTIRIDGGAELPRF